VLDSGAALLAIPLALIHPLGTDGVGVSFTDVGAFVGYGINVSSLVQGTVAQGVKFAEGNAAQLQGYYPTTIVLGPRSVLESESAATCRFGPQITLDDSGVGPDAGPDPMSVLIEATGAARVCEILGGALLDPSWMNDPVLAIGGVQTGSGTFEAAFDDVTVDFVSK